MINRKKEDITVQLKVAVERKFLLLMGHLVHFSLCFALHINELFKLNGIIFLVFEVLRQKYKV